jgi:dihydroorotase
MRIISRVKRTGCFSERTSYILQKRHRHDIVLNVHASTQDKTDDLKDSFCEQLEYVFDTFPKYHKQILLDIMEDISKARIGNESL